MQIHQSSAGKSSKMNLPVSTDEIFPGAESPEQFMQIFVKRTDVGGICETVMSQNCHSVASGVSVVPVADIDSYRRR